MEAMNETRIPRFIVMTAAARMPSSLKFGRYARVAVIETDGIHMPRQINPRHKSVVRIVETWERCNVGSTGRCVFEVAKREALELADQLNTENCA